MTVILTPKTVIHAQITERDDIGNELPGAEPEWVQIYAGPQTMTFNYKLLKERRSELGYTRDKAVIRKLDTLVADFPDIYKLMNKDEVSKTYSFPKSYISYRKPRAVSTKQRERARQMMIEQNKAKRD